MNQKSLSNLKVPRLFSFHTVLKWFVSAACIGIFAGIASAVFLQSLDWVTNYRETHVFIIVFLPLAGLLIGWVYHYWGSSIVKGNRLLLEEIHAPQQTLPFKIIPFIYLSTLVTHLFGGSAGREGTAIQMGGGIADQLARRLKFESEDRKLLLVAGISAGFASVFGTPLAGIVFGLEVVTIGKLRYRAIVPCILTATIATLICNSCGIQHTQYFIPFVPDLTVQGIVFSILAGMCFGGVSRIFSFLMHTITHLFNRLVPYAPFRPFIGGIVLVIALLSTGTSKYAGLGIPIILNAFQEQAPLYDFALKLVFTVFTLSAGFKGGEVTPLFFIGATLGSALSLFIPMPLGLMAGMGFISVFAGAAKTPITCILMSIELFGTAPGAYIAVACLFSTYVSGKNGIYHPVHKNG